MQKIRYEVDPYNRFVVSGAGASGDGRSRKSGLPKFRKVLDGRFKTDKGNNLSYHVKAPLSAGEKIPSQIRIKGDWSLTDGHSLRLTIDKSQRDTFGDRITLQGEILDAREDSLLFAVTTTGKGGQSTYVLNLGGTWKAGVDNRLSFHVKRVKGDSDILTFNSAWELGKDNQIIYQYEKKDLARKKTRTHTLAFKGYWRIREPFLISYVLEGGTDSVFNFRTSAGVFEKDRIKYELGIGLAGRLKPVRRTITLFGRWQLTRGIGLVFELARDSRKTRALVFGADAQLTERDTIRLRLKSDIDNRDLGSELELSRQVLKGGGEAFLRFLRSNRETAVYAGAAWGW